MLSAEWAPRDYLERASPLFVLNVGIYNPAGVGLGDDGDDDDKSVANWSVGVRRESGLLDSRDLSGLRFDEFDPEAIRLVVLLLFVLLFSLLYVPLYPLGTGHSFRYILSEIYWTDNFCLRFGNFLYCLRNVFLDRQQWIRIIYSVIKLIAIFILSPICFFYKKKLIFLSRMSKYNNWIISHEGRNCSRKSCAQKISVALLQFS